MITGSDGVLRGAPGGHPDAAAGAKCTLIVAPLLRGRMPTCLRAGGHGDDAGRVHRRARHPTYGVAVNPRRQDLVEQLTRAGIPLCTIESLKQKAYEIAGAPDPLPFDDRVVAIMEARDGTVLDVVREIKPIA